MRISTIKRNNSIHLMYKNIMNDLGQLRTVVSKSYIYNLIQILCEKHVFSYICSFFSFSREKFFMVF